MLRSSMGRVGAAVVVALPVALGAATANAVPPTPTDFSCAATGAGQLTIWSESIAGENSADVRDLYSGQMWSFDSSYIGDPFEIYLNALNPDQRYGMEIRVSDATGTSGWSAPCAPAYPRPVVGNLVLNPSVEQSLAHWQSLHGALTRAAGGSPESGGSYSIKVTQASGTVYNVSDSAQAGTMPTVLSAEAGSYMASAWVKAASASALGKPAAIGLRERDANGLGVRDTTSATVTLTNSWKAVWVKAAVARAGDTLGVRVEQRSAAAGNAMLVDDVHVHPYKQFMQTAASPQTVGVVNPDIKRVSIEDFTLCGQMDNFWINCDPVHVLTSLSAYVDGQAGGSGTATIRGVIYGGYEQPSGLVVSTQPVTITAGQKPGWVNLPLPHPVEIGTDGAWFGYQVGGKSTIVRFYGDDTYGCYDCGTSALSAWNKDAYSDGPSAMFGAYNNGKVTTMMRGSGGW